MVYQFAIAKRGCEKIVVADRSKPASINDRLAVEVLAQLLQFVSLRPHRNFQRAKGVALADTGEIVVARQFHLRYVCLRWHNIVHRSAELHLNALGLVGMYDNHARVLAQRRWDMELIRSSLRDESEVERQGVWFNLIDCIQSMSACAYNRADDSDSLLSTLLDATRHLTQPCELNLDYVAADLDVVRSTVESTADFSRLFPQITLRHLNLDTPDMSWSGTNDFAVYIENVRRCTNYILDIGTRTLESLSIDLTALDTMPEDWVCESLQKLNLGLEPLNFDRWEPWNDDEVRNEVVKLSRLPRMFPELKSIAIRTGEGPHVDLSILSEMEQLKTLEIFTSSNRQGVWQPCSLPNIASLEYHWREEVLPMRLSDFVLNVKQLAFDISQKKACIELLGQMSGSSFQQLIDISLKFDSYSRLHEVPPTADVIALFVVMHQLPALASLSFALNQGENADWCRPGDFSLLQVLPRSLRSCSFRYCLLPAPVVGSRDEAKFIVDPNVPDAEEAIYKAWFQTAVLRLCELPKLDRFYCRICAPSFHAAVSLAAKWSKNSSAAIAEFGVAHVVNIFCSTDAFVRIEPGQRYRRYDTLKFIFLVAARPGLTNKKFSTRKFTFELQCPA